MLLVFHPLVGLCKKKFRLEEPNRKNSSKPQSRNPNIYAKSWKLSIDLSSDNFRVKTLTYFDRLFRKHARLLLAAEKEIRIENF